MRIEVDQSGHKMGDSKGPTVLAFSHAKSHVIIVPANVKRACIRSLRRHYRKPKLFYIKLFSAAVFLLLKDYLAGIDLITMDVEYLGYEGTIRSSLLEYIRDIDPSFAADRITFRHIGKKSAAHKKAIETFRVFRKGRGKIKAKKIAQEELLALLIE